jgi:hypothetical protein
MSTYNEVFSQVQHLTSDEQLRLLAELAALVRQKITSELPRQEEMQEIGVDVSLESDPLVGLFADATDLATNSEDILQQEITKKSGWTWKEPLP